MLRQMSEFANLGWVFVMIVNLPKVNIGYVRSADFTVFFMFFFKEPNLKRKKWISF